jgi:hypothetical protein
VKGKSEHGRVDLGAGLIVKLIITANHQPPFLKTILVSYKLDGLEPSSKSACHEL